jgi:hypothetical protein
MTSLASMFSLSHKVVEGIVARIIVKREVVGWVDGDLVVFGRGSGGVERLEYLAGGLSEKLAGVIEGNERLLEGLGGYKAPVGRYGVATGGGRKR